MSIAENLKSVLEQIHSACRRAGRAPESVRLIAVSKTKPIAMIEEALRAGQRAFGENYVQEAVGKVEALPQAEWHFIGSLQTNKVKQVAGRFALVHSVDRLKLARELDRAAAAVGVVQDILLEIHIGDEETKHGISGAEAPAVLSEINAMKNLRVRGLMSLPPLLEDERAARANFAKLFELRERLAREVSDPASFTELSMGTSSDFEAAILEGATMVRVGTAIFGARA